MIYYNIDLTDFDYQQSKYKIEGWGISEKSQLLEFQVFKNSKELLDIEVMRRQRPDVQASLPQVQNAVEAGFCISIENFVQVLDGLKELKVRMECAGEKAVEYVLSRKDILKVWQERMMSYRLDVKDIHGDKLVLLGWHVDWLGKSELTLQDGEGNTLPCEFRRLVREDVSVNLNLEDKSYAAGFDVRVALKDIKNSKVYLTFDNGVIKNKIEIDVKQIQFEHSKQGRLWNVLGPAKWKEHAKYIRKEGLANFVEYTKQEIDSKYTNYHSWMKRHTLTKKQVEDQKKECVSFVYTPKISIIIPLYNTPLRYLEEMIESITSQTYSNWELCLADGSSMDEVEMFVKRKYVKDSRILYRRLENNMGISGNTNAALEMVTGDYVMLSDHDDLVVQGALYEIVKVLNEKPETDIIYTDEDKISMDGRLYFDPNFKSDFNIDLLRSVNYICHIFVVRKAIVDEVGVFRSEFDGAQDFDFILRCCEKTEAIHHIPKILYHWRAHPNSTAENPDSKRYAYDAGKNAVQEHYRRVNISAKVVDTKYFGIYRSIFALEGSPLISILILNKDHISDLDKCITSIMEKSTYRNFEVIVAENNSTEKETFEYYENIQEKYENVHVVRWGGEFNFSAINNFAAQYARGTYYVLLNNDIEVITPEWLEEMLGYCQREDVGMVGAKLYYPDRSIQHAGVVIGMGGIAGHILCRADGSEVGYNGRLVTAQDISAVTAACVMIKKEVYDAVGGLDETFKVAFNDIDLCMKVRELGKNIVFTPYAELYHYESKSRGLEDTPEKQLRFKGETERFQKKWSHVLEEGDPYYNPNLSLEEGDCSLKKEK